MPTPADYSASNLLNSLATYVAGQLLASGYLIYWHAADALQINTSATGWYFGLTANRATILATPAVASAMSTAKGVWTIAEAFPAEPRFVARLISDDSLGQPDEVQTPVLVFDLSPERTQDPYELGTRVMWRYRALTVVAVVRQAHEQRWVADGFARWLQHQTSVDVVNHDAGTLSTVGMTTLEDTRVDQGTFIDAADALTYQVVAGSIVTYVV